jgi:hypothetical protein
MENLFADSVSPTLQEVKEVRLRRENVLCRQTVECGCLENAHNSMYEYLYAQRTCVCVQEIEKVEQQ